MKKTSQLNQYKKGGKKRESSFYWHRSLRSAPKKPGVYFFLSKKSEVLYVGKSKNLYSRILSYKRIRDKQEKTKLFLKKAKSVKFLELQSDFDAIILESELIRVHQPKYNSRLKDDKSPIYIITTNEDYPKVLISRKTSFGKIKDIKYIFGPYTSASETKKVLRILRKLFPFCSKKNKTNSKPCFYYHIKLCPGACINKISKEDYNRNIKSLAYFLRGKKDRVLKKLEIKMQKASNQQNYELAAEIRNLHQSINIILQKTSFSGFDKPFTKMYDKKSILMQLWKLLAPFQSISSRKFPENPFNRIEAYDVSNISGKLATASMVVFSKGVPVKDEYRRFKIRFSQKPNDILMLSEALYRRLGHFEWNLPDLILVDGGKSQVRNIKRVLASKGLHHKILVVGLAKRHEELIIHKHNFHVINLKRDSPILLFLMHVRDEAHRFAKDYHKILRKKSLLKD